MSGGCARRSATAATRSAPSAAPAIPSTRASPRWCSRAIGGTGTLFSNVDTITDFKPGTDRIELENKIFAGVGGNGTLAAKYFHIGSHAADDNDHLIYNANTGVLAFDPDGKGGDPAIEFADFPKHLPLIHSDFMVN